MRSEKEGGTTSIQCGMSSVKLYPDCFRLQLSTVLDQSRLIPLAFVLVLRIERQLKDLLLSRGACLFAYPRIYLPIFNSPSPYHKASLTEYLLGLSPSLAF